MDDDAWVDPVFRGITGRYDVVIEGEPPVSSPSYAHLMREPCKNCGSSRLFLQGLTQRSDPTLPLFMVTVLCGNCGVDDERRDPDDRYTRYIED